MIVKYNYKEALFKSDISQHYHLFHYIKGHMVLMF